MDAKIKEKMSAAGSSGEAAGESVYEFPCSLAQQRFWLLDQIEPGQSNLNIAVRWRLKGRLDAAIAARAFNAMVARHEVLRTSFRDSDGVPHQVVWPHLAIDVPVVDASGLLEAERERKAEEVTLQVAKEPFDLSRPPLLRMTVLRLGSEEHVALVTVHHCVADGWSIGIMARELGEFYERFSGSKLYPLPELPLQYADFSVWQQDWLKSGALAPLSEYWKKKLAAMRPLEVAPDFPRPAVQTGNGTILSGLLPRALTDALKDFSNRQSVTLYTTALAAFKLMLWQWTGQTDVSVGTQVAGRSRVELEPLVGVFINTLVLRTEVDARLKFSDWLRRVETTVGEAIAHQEMPFEQLVEALRPKRDRSRGPLFNINFIYQRAFIENREFAGVSLIDLPSRSPGAIYDLNFFMVERIEGWRWSCEYNTDLYRPETVKAMLAAFECLLQAIVENPERTMAEFTVERTLAAGDVREISAAALPASKVARSGVSRAEVQKQLTRIWQELLDVNAVDPASDFFELGGHSLLATRMLARIDKVFGKKIPLAALFASPTIQSLTDLIAGKETSAFSPHAAALAFAIPGLVPVQPKGARPAIFCVHGIPSMKLLARELGDDQPFYLVHLPERAGEPTYDVEAIAAVHLTTIRKAQPRGPYFLTGWCREGLLALEVAHQLQAANQEVALVTIFDTWIPKYLSRFSPREALRARRLFEVERALLHVRKLREMGAGQALRYVWNEARQVLGDRMRYARMHVSYRLHSEKSRPSQDEALFIAAGRYAAKPYAGRVQLFRSDKYRTWKYWDRALGWSEMLPALTVEEIAGYHDSMLTGSELPRIARAITQAMNETMEQNESRSQSRRATGK